MAEWLKSNPCLYNKKLESYRKSDMKKRMWEEKAAEFANVDVDYLLGWYKSTRTRFGKLSKIPSGSGAQELSLVISMVQTSVLAVLFNAKHYFS